MWRLSHSSMTVTYTRSYILFLHSHAPASLSPYTATGWQRPIGCHKLQIIFRKRATNYRALLREMTCNDNASDESLPLWNTVWNENALYKCVYVIRWENIWVYYMRYTIIYLTLLLNTVLYQMRNESIWVYYIWVYYVWSVYECIIYDQMRKIRNVMRCYEMFWDVLSCYELFWDVLPVPE